MLQMFSPDDHICATCAHFIPHYVRSSSRYIPLYMGHCMYPRIKSRSVEQTCPRWEQPQETEQNADG